MYNDPMERFIPLCIGIVLIAIVGAVLYFVTETIKKKKPKQWESFEEKVDQFNDKHVGDMEESTREFLEKNINTTRTKYIKEMLKEDEEIRKTWEKD